MSGLISFQVGITGIAGITPESLTYEQALNLFLLRGKAAGNSATTTEHYRITLSHAFASLRLMGAGSPAAVSSVHVTQLLDENRKRGLSSSSLQTRYRHLRTLFGFLVSDGMLTRNPTDGVPRPKVENKIPQAFTPEHFTTLLGAVEKASGKTPMGRRDLALFCLLFDSGARLSEALSIRIGELDLAQNVVNIRGKGGKHRLITWGDRTRKALIDWLRSRPDAKPEDVLFCNQFCGPLSRGAVRIRLKRLTQAAGIAAPRLGAHAMRHGCAISLLRGGADLETVRRVLGHSRLNTTQIYLQGLSDEDALARAREVSVVDRLGVLPGERRTVRLR